MTNYLSRVLAVTLLACASLNAIGAGINVAAQTNGGVASASSSYSSDYPASSVNNADRKGLNWGAGGGWNDSNANQYPDWVQITFNGQKSIDEIDVFTVQDNYANPAEPTASMTFTQYGNTVFDVQYWNGTAWVTVPGGSISGNNLVWRKITFAAITTDRIRVLVNASLAGYSRITEIEAYGGGAANAPPSVNLTAPANNASYTAPASITLDANATDSDGTITQVEFYNGAVLLNTDTVAPYSFNWTNVPAGSYILTAKATDNSGATTISAPINVTVNAAGGRINVAAQTNGGIATASSIYSSNYPAASVNNADRKGSNWGAGGGWNDASSGQYPDWVQVTFNGQKSIDEIDVFNVQDNYANPVEPTANMSFTLYGNTAFDVQYWNGAAWVTVPGGSISGNNLVWRKITFAAITTDRIRVLVNASLAGYSRITEIEAYGGGAAANVPPSVNLTAPANNASYTAPASITLDATATDSDGTVTQVEFYNGAVPLNTDTVAPYSFTWTNVPAGNYILTAKATDNSGAVTSSAPINVTVNAAGGRINVAAQTNGGIATASSIYSSNYPASSVNNADRKGLNWGAGGGWNDSNANQYPDWVQVTFNGQKTIDEIDVFTVQDNYANPAEPTASMTFTQYGNTVFDVQYWNGTSWVTVPGGSISGNNLVWRKISFSTITTDRIRVLVNASLAGYSRITEIEAYGGGAAANVPPSVSLLAPAASDSFTAPANFSIIANATDVDGNIQRVDFYNGAALLGSAIQSPYLYNWLNVAAGTYTLTAKAFDNANASTTSAPVTITVNAPQVAPGIYYLFADHLNTPRVITDQTNKTVWRWDSDAFGTSIPFEDPDGDGIKFTYNNRFPGQYYDAETGLHQNYFRDYDPSTGRYPQFDPIGLRGGINGYAYVNGNPISRIDPLGLAGVVIPGPVPLPLPGPVTPVPGKGGDDGSMGGIFPPGTFPVPTDPYGPGTNTERPLTQPDPLPPKKPGTGCRAIFDACVTGLGRVCGQVVSTSICFAAWLICEATQ